MNENSYTSLSDDLYRVLEQDDDIRHSYMELLGLLRDLVATHSSRYIEVVYERSEIDPKIGRVSEFLKKSQHAAATAFSNINLGRNLVKASSNEAIDRYLDGIYADFDRIRMIRSKRFDFEHKE